MDNGKAEISPQWLTENAALVGVFPQGSLTIEVPGILTDAERIAKMSAEECALVSAFLESHELASEWLIPFEQKPTIESQLASGGMGTVAKGILAPFLVMQ
jgi:hypothetical protein